MFSRVALRSVPALRAVATRAASTSAQRAQSATRFASLGLGAAAASALLLSQDALHAASPAVDFASVRKDIAKIIEESAEKNGDGTSIGPTLVRLAWHASGTYSKVDHTGGSNGATMRYPPESSWGANAGLAAARTSLESIKQKYPSLSYADIWTLAGAVAIEEMGGPAISWRPGRSDFAEPTLVPDGRLPAADKGSLKGTIQHIRDIFGRMGFNDREMVALIGAHALGRCHTNASGYWGPWTRAETTFSNEYFRLLLEEKWTLKTTHKGAAWTGPDQFEDPSGELMMLPADMALIWDKKFRSIVEDFATDEDVFFKEFSKAFSKLMELGVPFAKVGGGGGFLSKLLKMVGLA